MADYRKTRLWLTALEPTTEPEGASEARARLCQAFIQFRDRAKALAGEIHRALPDFTVHDITHLDALWEMADLIAGPDISLTPPEAFVLGGSILLHDLGMGLAAYPGGLDEIRKSQVWKDSVTLRMTERLGRRPTSRELEDPPTEVQDGATREALRTLHAERAAVLPSVQWADRSGTIYHLIEDVDLRTALGSLIGHLAYSHHWPVSKLAAEFAEELGALADFPAQWTINPLKIACLLRLADAAHIDARRAPAFLGALRRLNGTSSEHWTFQGRMHKPILKGDRLEFSSARAFPLSDAPAWRLLLEALRMIDRELRQVDALLSDVGAERFAARGVIGVDDPVRLSKLIRTEGWSPVDAHIKVENVASLVNHLGGEELYGKNPLVPLRELIQNASDAVRARRVLDDLPRDWGDVVVRLGQDEHGHWLEVEDSGVGMSERVLTGPLLDFGGSYWQSGLAREEFPGLLSKGFWPVGKYGIGFFSIFMWGVRVKVTTRRYTDARKDTRVLQFEAGAASHPILRPATPDECLREGGTRVRVWFASSMTPGKLLQHANGNLLTLKQVCFLECPTVDVNLHTDHEGKKEIAIRASDWCALDGGELFLRTARFFHNPYVVIEDVIEDHARRLRPLYGVDGEVLGRACVSMAAGGPFGMITVGGFCACTIDPFAGVFQGMPLRAARDSAVPLVPPEELASWASEQAKLLEQGQYGMLESLHASHAIRACGGRTASLPVARASAIDKWLSFDQIVEWSRLQEKIRLISGFEQRDLPQELILDSDVLIVPTGTPFRPVGGGPQSLWPWHDERTGRGIHEDLSRSLKGAVLEAVATAWSLPLSEVLSQLSAGDIEFEMESVATDAQGERFLGWILAVLKKPSFLGTL